MFRRLSGGFAAIAMMAGSVPVASAPASSSGEAQFRAIYKELVETDTSFESGNCTTLTEKIAARMKAAGYPERDIYLFVPEGHPKAGALVVVYPGRDSALKPVLMLGHVDVVNARRADWTRDPYTLIEEGGYFYGRGTTDMKAQDAIWIDNLLRFRAAGYKPLRTVKMALTCGEEGLYLNGARWLVQNQRELIDAGLALNEGGGGELDAGGKPVVQTVQAAQKVVMTFTLEATNPGGHSSRPRPDNAIYSLARGLDRLSAYDFPVILIDANRAYFSRMAKVVGGEDGAAMSAIVADPTNAAANATLNRNPSYHTMLRTTCVATMLQGGHAANALPQRATATVNCRVMPGTSREDVQAALVKAVADPELKVTAMGSGTFGPSTPAPLTSAVMGPIEKVSQKIWPGVPVVPNLAAGATDAVSLNAGGIPTYGVSGLFRDPDGGNAHGLNERIRVKAVMDGRAYLYELVKAFADQKG